mmetsp:Transcript_60976/g.113144  ORF Transcript_60976/g.113144 Transcript_60976/m.113144 type:complete len:170 (-) Transcript_60976:223-732(-)
MGVKQVTMLLASLMALSPQLALSDHHSMLRVLCINETHHAVYHHDHDHNGDDEDEDDDNTTSGDDEDEDGDTTNMTNVSRRLMHHMNMSNMSMDGWEVLENTEFDPCGSAACNATCNATSCTPMRCTVPIPETSTTTSGPGIVSDGTVHGAAAAAILPLLSSMLALLSS